jgi:hypothetical protein
MRAAWAQKASASAMLEKPETLARKMWLLSTTAAATLAVSGGVISPCSASITCWASLAEVLAATCATAVWPAGLTAAWAAGAAGFGANACAGGGGFKAAVRAGAA